VPDLATIHRALVAGFEDGLGIRAVDGAISDAEEVLARRYYDEEIGRDEFVAEIDNPAADAETLGGTHTGPGGTVNAFVRLEGPTSEILQRVLLTGDFFVTPPRTVFDLEVHLQGTRLDDVEQAIDEFFAANEVDTLSVSADDFKASIADALRDSGVASD
jgi:lipoate-protein ligase A